MEHRWGERIAVRLTVELACGSAPPVAGSLENVSSSGAFVSVDGRGPPRGPVEVILQDSFTRAQAVRLPAYVVRQTAAGVGIEWCEFAPRAVRELMVRDRRGSGARALPAGRHSQRGAIEMGAPARAVPESVLLATVGRYDGPAADPVLT